MRTRTGRFAALLVCLLVPGCATTLDSLPLPAPGLGGSTYTVTAVFANALNLPAQAKVKLDGADIGAVESMTARDYTAVVTLRLRSAVTLPVGTKAELRSATPMGDVFVALDPPDHADPAAGLLHDGSTIPQASTSAAATIEDVLSRAALLVDGGALRNLTTVVNALGDKVGGRGDQLAGLIRHTSDLLATLSARSDRIRSVLAAAGQLGSTVAAQQSAIDAAMGAAGPALQVVGDDTDSIVQLVDRIHVITGQLARFPSIRGTNEHSLSSAADLLGQDLNDAAVNPAADLNYLNGALATILKVTNSSSAHVDVDVAQFALGAGADPNFPGDPGARPPDATDWMNFVGSLDYNLARLQGRIAPAAPGEPGR